MVAEMRYIKVVPQLELNPAVGGLDLVVLWVVVLLVGLEKTVQVWQLEHELVHVDLELERGQRDELLLLNLVVWLVGLVLVCHHSGNHGEQNDGDDELVRRCKRGLVHLFSFLHLFLPHLSKPQLFFLTFHN